MRFPFDKITRFFAKDPGGAKSEGNPYPCLVKVIDAGACPLDCLVFGDSVMVRVSNHDFDRRALGDMIYDRLAPSRVVVIARSAYHPLIFELLLKVVQTQPFGPAQAIVLPINIRCFSPQWNFHPAWQLNEEQRAIQNHLRSGRIRFSSGSGERRKRHPSL